MKEAVLVEVGERRVYFRDVKPYHAPESLADLRGPTSGRVFLPKTVWWAPGDGWIDIDEPGGTSLAYRVVITEGQPENQIAVLNAETLKKSGATSCYLSGFELCGKQNFRNFAMAQSRAEFDSQFQHRITREALAAVGEFGFVLAGAGALREHGLIDRPTEDIDLFTIQKHEQDVPHAVDTLMTTLRDAGLEVTATHVT